MELILFHVDGHANVRESAVMTDDNDNDADVGNLDHTLSEILGVSIRVTTSLNLDLAFGAIDVNDHFSLHSPPSPLPSPLLLLLLLLGSPSEIQEFSLS